MTLWKRREGEKSWNWEWNDEVEKKKNVTMMMESHAKVEIRDE